MIAQLNNNDNKLIIIITMIIIGEEVQRQSLIEIRKMRSNDLKKMNEIKGIIVTVIIIVVVVVVVVIFD